MTQTTLLFDSTFEGLFTTIFEIYDKKISNAAVCRVNDYTPALFCQHEIIQTDLTKANRVLKGLRKKMSASGLMKLKKTFHSDLKGIDNTIVELVTRVFASRKNIESDYRQDCILQVNKVNKMVNREIHRMHAFIRFQKTIDNIYAATIKPDFDVIPFIGNHFKNRYADQEWIIYDTHRNYGLHYNLENVSIITISSTNWVGKNKIDPNILAENETNFQRMWKQYFDATCIKERKNLRLHLQHVPHRYWHYLPEKHLHKSV